MKKMKQIMSQWSLQTMEIFFFFSEKQTQGSSFFKVLFSLF